MVRFALSTRYALSSLKNGLLKFSDGFINLLYPATCPGCGQVLLRNEALLCLTCRHNLPLLSGYADPDTAMGNEARALAPLRDCFAYMLFKKDGLSQNVVYAIKYKGNQALGRFMGHRFGEALAGEGLQHEYDLLLPVPLHKTKLKKRGFNQSLLLAQGFSESSGIALAADCLLRIQKTETQTRKTKEQRLLNVKEAFLVNNPDAIRGKSLLLIDDVFTTGATITTCANLLLQAGAASVSVCALAYADKG